MPDPREELRQALQDDPKQELRSMLDESDQTTAFGTFINRFLKGVGDSAMAIPSASGDLLAMAAAAPALMPGGKTPGEAYREQQQMFPANVIRAIPRPTTDQVIAGGRAALAAVPGGVSPSDQYGFSIENANRLKEQQDREHPIAAGFGDIGGSIAMLLATKSPLQSTIRETEKRLTRKPDLFFGGAQTAEAVPGVSRVVQGALNSSLARYGARGGFRAAETGLEAAYMEVLNSAENDPILAAGLAAGGQVGASMSIEALKGAKNLIPGAPLLSLGVSALSTAGLWQMLKSATPAGRDRILESIESGYDKVTYAMILGALGGAIGARGRNSSLYEDFLPVSEAMMTVPRGTVLSLLSDFVDAPDEERSRFEETLDKIMNNADFEGVDEFEKGIVRRFREGIEYEGGDRTKGIIRR